MSDESENQGGPQRIDIRVNEPSAVAYHPGRDTLLIVSDEGGLYELDRDYTRRERYKLGGDLEGVAVDPSTGLVYIASEDEGAILEFDPETERVKRTMVIDFQTHPDFKDPEEENKGIEGVAVVRDGEGKMRLLAVVQSGPARMIELAVREDKGKGKLPKRLRRRVRARREMKKSRHGRFEKLAVVRATDVDLDPLSDIIAVADLGVVVVISAKTQEAAVCRPDGTKLGMFKLPGSRPEGLTFLPGGKLLVVDDHNRGLYEMPEQMSQLEAIVSSAPERSP